MDIRWRGCLLEIIETIVLTVVIFFVFQTFIAQPYQIEQVSMENTVQPGQYVLVDKLSPHWSGYKRGEIIVFDPPPGYSESDGQNIPFIKRVVAKGGDVVQVVNHHVFVNGRMLVEGYTLLPDYIKDTYEPPPRMPPGAKIPLLPDYLKQPQAFNVEVIDGRVQVSMKGAGGIEALDRGNFGPYRIPAGHLFMMGDNRMNSEDSRYWGALDQRLVLGKAWVIWWSFKERDDDYLRNSPGEVARRFSDKILHFFGKTRWNRIFMRPR